MHRSHRRLLERLGRWPRLAAAGLCLLVALALAVRAPGRRRLMHLTRVVIATAHLPAGHVLRAGDLAVARWPAQLRPAGAAAAVDRLVGTRLAGPLGAREPVTPSRLLGADLTAGLAAGVVATTVSLADPGAADLVHAGDQVDLLATPRPDLEVPDATGPGPPPGCPSWRAALACSPCCRRPPTAKPRWCSPSTGRPRSGLPVTERPKCSQSWPVRPSLRTGDGGRRVKQGHGGSTCSRASKSSSCAATSSTWRSPSSLAPRSVQWSPRSSPTSSRRSSRRSAASRTSARSHFTINKSTFLYGAFINAIITFVIIAAAIYFVVVLPLNKMAERRAAKLASGEPEPEPMSEDVQLLTEIRDLLAAQRSSGPKPN